MELHCKLCHGSVDQLHRIQNITYYHCAACNFLQNYYWEEQTNQVAEQSEVNQEERTLRWPAGERAHMRAKGWEMLELMSWPLAWFSRIAHTLLKRIPPYSSLVRWWVKRKFKKILDFGCGHGTTVLEMRDKDDINMVGLDPYSPTQNPHIRCQLLTQANFPDNTFDGIFTIETMEHIPNVLETFLELHRILKPGGTLLVQTRRLEDPEYINQQIDWFYLREPKTHVSIYSEKAMSAIAQKAGFRSVQFRGIKFARFIK